MVLIMNLFAILLLKSNSPFVTDLSARLIIVLVMEVIFNKLPLNIVTDDHALCFIRNLAFVADV
jgi:hypothetical protein